jgi:hypothetical protein
MKMNNLPRTTPYVATAAFWKSKKTTGHEPTMTAIIELTPALIAAAQENGQATVYVIPNSEKTSPRSRKPDYIAYVATEEDEGEL